MPLHRREFMKVLGISAASLLLARCNWRSIGIAGNVPSTPEITCYEPTMEVFASPPPVTAARDRLRLHWLRFDELAQVSAQDTENKLGEELIAGHRAALDELVAMSEISAPVADLVQEGYDAAVYHVWRSNAPISCYILVDGNYAPRSAAVLIEQSRLLNQIAGQGDIDPDTLAKAQAALEHDLAFYALTHEEVQALYEQLRQERADQSLPSFEALPLELTPEVQDATQYIVDLLMGH